MTRIVKIDFSEFFAVLRKNRRRFIEIGNSQAKVGFAQRGHSRASRLNAPTYMDFFQ